MTRSLRLLSFVVVASAATVPAAAALARPTRVALTHITGDTTGLSKAVAGALDGELDVVSGKQVTRAIDRLGLDDALGDRDLARLADELEVDAVVKGAFNRRGHRLRFTIFASGKHGKPFSLQVGNPGTERFRKLVRTTVVARLAQIVPKHRGKASDGDEVAEDDAATPPKTRAKAGKPEVADAAEPRHKASAAEAAEPARPRHKAAEADAAADEPARSARPAGPHAAAPAGDDEAPPTAGPRVAARDDDDPASSVRAPREPASPAIAHSANLAALRVDLGASMAGRSLRFDTRAFDGAPRPYKNAPVPGARVAAELYPLALVAPGSWLAGLGVAADYDRTIALTLRASDERTVPLQIAERHYGFGLRYRLAFGHRPTSPTLTVGAGYGARRFAVDRSGLMSTASLDLPDVDYRMFDPGLAFRLPLGGLVAITVAGQGLIVTSAGPIQRADQYGAARVLGGTASAGVELAIGERIAVRVAAEATQLDLSFTGTGMLAASRDGDSSTVDVRGATDRYYGGVATVAVTY